MKLFMSFLSGFLFSLGLIYSQMTNPNKVIGFLDIFGNWDSALLFVMAGAVGINLISFRLVLKRKPLCDSEHYLPSKIQIDKKLLLGSALFGIGWGMVGICPGPAIVNLVTGRGEIYIFFASMLAGMFIYQLINTSGKSESPLS